MKVADYIGLYLESRRVTHVFELVGGMITFLLDSLHQKTRIRVVSMHHEQGAGFAAEGYGRMTGTPGVAMATSGPGATNLLTAIGSCYFDSTPTVFITGQVNRHEQKGERDVRQLGFQETDIVSMARPVTKAAWLVNDPDDLPRLLEEAFTLACSGRQGPVLIDIPMDVQRAEITDVSRLEKRVFQGVQVEAESAEASLFLDCLLRDLRAAKRPLILVGGGIHSACAVNEFRAIAALLDIPVIHSLMAVDALPSSDPLRVGLIGSYGNRWANIALAESDFLLVLGSRLDVRQTGADTTGFRGDKTIYHVDCQAGEINNRITGCNSIVCELGPFFAMFQRLSPSGACFDPWKARIFGLRLQWPDTGELPNVTGINPNVFMHQLAESAVAAAAYIVDVGQHQMWAAQSIEIGQTQRFMTSGGMGAMGFALPAAIGVCFAAGSKEVVVIAGDGGFQLNIQELQTVARNKLPVKMIVINNQCHGMVRQFQEAYFKERYQSTVWGYSAPSFEAVARSYGLPSMGVRAAECVPDALAACFADAYSPFLLEVHIEMSANAYPKMAFGRPISEMEPFAKPLDMEGT